MTNQSMNIQNEGVNMNKWVYEYKQMSNLQI